MENRLVLTGKILCLACVLVPIAIGTARTDTTHASYCNKPGLPPTQIQWVFFIEFAQIDKNGVGLFFFL